MNTLDDWKGWQHLGSAGLLRIFYFPEAKHELV